MNEKIVKEWIAEIKAFAKTNSCRHLRYPMFMESVMGDMLSPEGILCTMHAKAGKGKWLPEEVEGKRLRGCTNYDGSFNTAPESVLKWVGLSAGVMSEVRRENGDSGLNGVVKYLEQLLAG